MQEHQTGHPFAASHHLTSHSPESSSTKESQRSAKPCNSTNARHSFDGNRFLTFWRGARLACLTPCFRVTLSLSFVRKPASGCITLHVAMYPDLVILRHYSNEQCFSCFLFEQRLPHLTLLSLAAQPSHRGLISRGQQPILMIWMLQTRSVFQPGNLFLQATGPPLVVLPVLLVGDDLQLIALS